MRAVLIPVKDLSKAKQRLAAQLSPLERSALARAMLEDFFSVVSAARGIDRVFVISNEPVALEGARKLGWELIPETDQVSESDSVDFASRWCAERGVTALLRLPIDIPLAVPRDIEALFEELPPPPAIVIVPSRDGTGTNALLRTPPALFPSHFGPGSFARHLAEAAKCHARTKVVRNPRLALDVDDPEDLRLLPASGQLGAATRAWLLKHGFQRERPDAPGGGREAGVMIPKVAGQGSADR